MTTRIRTLTESDIPATQRLREQAGWNQTDADWQRLLRWSPAGCWVAERGGTIVGTTTVATYGQRIAWIGMVLVDEAQRRQGIGRALLQHAIEYLDQTGIQTVALDSTPEGQPLYASLGFRDAFELSRWRGPLRQPTTARDLSTPGADDGVLIRPCAAHDLAPIAAYDAQLFGTDRTHILRALMDGHGTRGVVAEQDGQIVGYGIGRPGARAWHLGPLAANDPATAGRLVRAIQPDARAASEAQATEMVMDVIVPNVHAVALAGALGLAPVRRFIRMTRGAPPPSVDTSRLYTSAGPELG